MTLPRVYSHESALAVLAALTKKYISLEMTIDFANKTEKRKTHPDALGLDTAFHDRHHMARAQYHMLSYTDLDVLTVANHHSRKLTLRNSSPDNHDDCDDVIVVAVMCHPEELTLEKWARQQSD